MAESRVRSSAAADVRLGPESSPRRGSDSLVSPFLAGWGRAFALTLAVEVPLVVALTKGTAPPFQRIALAVIANLASHPLVWFVFPELGLDYHAWLGLAEAWAVLVETFVYMTQVPALGLRRAALVSLTANAASVAAGFVLRAASVNV